MKISPTTWSATALVLAAAFGLYLAAGDRHQPQILARCLDAERADRSAHHGMVFVPAGDFEFGDDVYPEEGPIVKAHARAFWMDGHDVTNAEFARFVAATHYLTDAEKPVDERAHPGLSAAMLGPGAMVFVAPADLNGADDISQWWHYIRGANWRHPGGPGTSIDGRDDYPVVEVTYNDALAYARWRHRELPTEREWEWAARGGRRGAIAHQQPHDANTWQGIFPIIDSGEDGFKGLAPVGCFKPNAYGLYDMIGNVWEWTSDRFELQHGEQPPDSTPQRGGSVSYVIKGGSFLCAPNYCFRYRPGAREPQEADLAASHLGFRTILRGLGPP